MPACTWAHLLKFYLKELLRLRSRHCCTFRSHTTVDKKHTQLICTSAMKWLHTVSIFITSTEGNTKTIPCITFGKMKVAVFFVHRQVTEAPINYRLIEANRVIDIIIILSQPSIIIIAITSAIFFTILCDINFFISIFNRSQIGRASCRERVLRLV